jgi:hypothetical protein
MAMIGAPPLCLHVPLVSDTSNDSARSAVPRQLEQTVHRSSAICLELAGPLLLLAQIKLVRSNADKFQ